MELKSYIGKKLNELPTEIPDYYPLADSTDEVIDFLDSDLNGLERTNNYYRDTVEFDEQNECYRWRNNAVKMPNGQHVDYEAAVSLMDDDLREQLHAELAPCTQQEFLIAYCEAHKEKYGEEFQI